MPKKKNTRKILTKRVKIGGSVKTKAQVKKSTRSIRRKLLIIRSMLK